MLTPTQIAQLKSSQNQSFSPTANLNPDDGSLDRWISGTGVNAPAADATPAAQAHPGMLDTYGDQITGAKDKITSSIKEGAAKFAAEPTDGSFGTEVKRTGDLLETGLGTAAGAVQAIFAPVTAAFQGAANATGIHPMDAFQNSDTGKKFNAWVEQNPEMAKNLSDALTVGTAGMGAEIAPAVGTRIASGVEEGMNAGKQVFKTGKEAIDSARSAADAAKASAQVGTDLQKINDMITPKPTAGQAKIAMDEGRLYKGKNPSLFSPGTPDKVAADAQQAKSAFTINRLIPDAAKLDEPTLYGALDEHVTKLAQELEPKLTAAPVDKPVISKLNEDWDTLKKEQIADAKATDEPNVAKWQANFEKYLKKSGSENMNELWNAAKEYDRSIKSNVKNATDLSPEDLQTQKEIWLQNRAILRAALKDSTTKLGKETSQAFSDMTDLYEAQNGILSKAKIEKTGAPSGISSFLKTPTGKAVKTGAGLIVGDKVIKAATGFGI